MLKLASSLNDFEVFRVYSFVMIVCLSLVLYSEVLGGWRTKALIAGRIWEKHRQTLRGYEDLSIHLRLFAESQCLASH